MSVDGRVLSSKVGSSNGSSSRFASSSIVITSSMQPLMAPNSLEAHEGYFISFVDIDLHGVLSHLENYFSFLSISDGFRGSYEGSS